jgi:hypothetical protein
MSWIKENKFLAGLIGGTLAAVVGLYFVGSQGATKYDDAKAEFDTAVSETSTFERSPLYPSDENANAKSKALDGYKADAGKLQAAFEPFRPKEIKNISPQDFGNTLVKANEDLRKSFTEANVKVPEPFFCGFETYRTNLAAGPATGILSYQLDAVRFLMQTLASSGASELKNLHRPALAEEEGKQFMPADSAVARPLPLEITFSGPEKSVRTFVTAITKLEERHFVIRSLRIANAKTEPPRTADAKFDAPKPANTSNANDLFSGGFVFPGDEPAAGAPKPEAPKPAPAADSSRILSQVLGNEDVHVFLRLDLMQFLPAKKLP